MKWNGYPNLRKRPPASAKGRGPVQRAIRRAFAASDTEVLTSSSIYEWAHVRRRRGRRKSMPRWRNESVRLWRLVGGLAYG